MEFKRSNTMCIEDGAKILTIGESYDMGNQKNKSRSQKEKFAGNRYTERNNPLDVTTVSEQKLSSTSVSTENIAPKDDKT
ncbi:hypothetical protein TNCT_116341 [Trichonephila clavata]|uniref:Uncharacterized protein n=1 Tax=Trichonephila clavata TaxID=2740835 RepID=A0A8X6M426_TRICU|nr:hypothetical protein TNCT_116341 [Trichonephila clavata]